MVKKTDEVVSGAGETDAKTGGGTLADFSCVILADRGGVGKTATAALIWALLDELGETPRIGEVEGPHERKLTALLDAAQAGKPDPDVVIPSPADLADNPRLNARTFGPVLAALVDVTRPTLIDNGATVSRALLDAAEAASHGDQTDGGRGLRLVVVAKAEDMQSATSAQVSLERARVIYPNAIVVLVVTHVQHDRQRRTHNAAPIVAAVEAGGKASAVVLVPALNNPLVGELYGEKHIPFHLVAGLPVGKLHALLPDTDEQEARIYRGQFLTWYNAALGHLAAALHLPAPAPASKGATRPLETVGVSA